MCRSDVPLHPLGRHVDAFRADGGPDFHYGGMVKFAPDRSFALEAIEENGVAFGFGMGNFDRHLFAGKRIGSAKNRSHAAFGDELVQLVMIEPVAGI